MTLKAARDRRSFDWLVILALMLLDLLLLPIRFIVYLVDSAADWADFNLRQQRFRMVKQYEKRGLYDKFLNLGKTVSEKLTWLHPTGSNGSDRSFLRRWRFWVWFDRNADYGASSWRGSIRSGYLMARELGNEAKRGTL